MSCDKCDCLDCRSDRAIAQAKNLANDVDDDSVMPAWCFAGKANDVQAKAWGDAADFFLSRYAPAPIHVRTLVSVIMYRCNVRHENQSRMAPQVERYLHENYAVAKGGEVSKLEYISMTSIADAPNLLDGSIGGFTIKSIKDDYTCGCGNTKCSKVELSCWKCGAPIKP